MKFTNSQIKAFQRCKKQHDYKFVQGIVPRHSALPLKRGSWLHELLEAKYKTGNWRKRHKELTKEFMKMFEEEREMYGNLPAICAHIMECYDYHWRDEDDNLRFFNIETEYEVPVPHGHTMGFKIDGLAEDEYGIWLVEHKTHKAFPNDEYRAMDIQTAKYAWGLIKLGIPIVGILWNYLLTVEPKKPALLKDGSRLSKRKARTDLFTFVDAIQEYGLDPHDYRDDIMRLKNSNDFFRRERVPKPMVVMKELMKEAIYTADDIASGYEPVRSIDRSCTYMCSYLDICSISLYGGDISSLVKSRYQPAKKDDYYGYTEKDQNA